MSLHDTDALIVEAATAAESLPDPTTVTGRTHDLCNTGTANAVWSSTGATPFSVDGVPAATLTVLPGRARRVQSDGTRWVVAPTAARRVYAATAVTDGSGNLTLSFGTPFSAAPVVTVAYQGAASPDPVDYRITAVSAASVSIHVRRSPATAIALLGLTLLGASVPLAGATMHVVAIEPGQGV